MSTTTSSLNYAEAVRWARDHFWARMNETLPAYQCTPAGYARQQREANREFQGAMVGIHISFGLANPTAAEIKAAKQG